MIATKHLPFIALGLMVIGGGAAPRAHADIALDGVPPSSHTASQATSVDTGDPASDTTTAAPASHSSHRKKHKSSTTAKTPDGGTPQKAPASGSSAAATTSTTPISASAPGTSAPPSVATSTKKKKHSKTTSAATDTQAAITGGPSPGNAPAGTAVTTPARQPTATSGAISSTPVTPPATGSTIAPTTVPKSEVTKTGRKKRHGHNAATADSAPATAPLSTTPSTPGTAGPVPHETIVVTPSTGPLTSTPSALGAPSVSVQAAGPTVQTGLPVARPGTGTTATLPVGLMPALGAHPHSTSTSTYLPPMTKFPFTDYPLPAPRTPTHTYPWKTNIITTVFWIGEGGSTLSSTTNYAGAWNMEWMHDNGGTDDPDDEDSYAQRGHASTLNPFYVALPFNDLVYPDKARRWIPSYWFKPSRNGKQVSACQHRWVEIKMLGSGRTCYAQWEDVGPLRYDHAEYVFGPERPDTLTHAGLDVSPAVAKYLGIDRHGSARTSWKFVDDNDVQPGMWLKYDEQAIIFRALKDQERHGTTPPIQDMAEPTPDDSSQDANQKKAGAARG
jgi:hypothetical protein